MRKVVATIAVLVSLVSATILYKQHEARIRHLRLSQEAAELMWNGFLTEYQHEVPLGTRRSEVRKYLDSKIGQYLDGHDILVKLGETPDEGVCDYWTVSAAFEFHNDINAQPSPADELTGISLRRIGHCL